MKNLKVTVAEMKNLVERIGRFSNKKNKVSLFIGLPGQVTTSTMQCVARISSQIATADIFFEASAEEQVLDSTEPLATVHVVADTFCNYARALLAYDSDISLEISETALVLRAGEDAKLAIEVVSAEDVEELISRDASGAIARLIVSPSELLKVAQRGCSLAEDGDSSLAGNVFLSLEADCFRGYSIATGNSALACSTGKYVEKAPGEYAVSFVPEAVAYNFLSEIAATSEASKAQVLKESVDKILAEKGSLLELAKEHGLANASRYSFSMAQSAFGLLKTTFADASKQNVDYVQLLVTPTVLHVKAGNVCTWIVLSNTSGKVVDNLFKHFGTSKWTHKMLVNKEQLSRAISLHQLSGSAAFTLQPSENSLVSVSNGADTSTVLIGREGVASEIGEYSFSTKVATKALSAMENGNAILSFTLDASMKGKTVRLSNGAMDGTGEDCTIFLMAVSPAQAEVEKSTEPTSSDTE